APRDGRPAQHGELAGGPEPVPRPSPRGVLRTPRRRAQVPRRPGEMAAPPGPAAPREPGPRHRHPACQARAAGTREPVALQEQRLGPRGLDPAPVRRRPEAARPRARSAALTARPPAFRVPPTLAAWTRRRREIRRTLCVLLGGTPPRPAPVRAITVSRRT